ncbi:hypothetical protein ACWKWP_09205 [Agromyces soli]
MSTAIVFASGAARVEHDVLGAGRLAAGLVDLVRRSIDRMPRRRRASTPDHEEVLLRRRNQAIARQLVAERHGAALRVGGAPVHS